MVNYLNICFQLADKCIFIVSISPDMPKNNLQKDFKNLDQFQTGELVSFVVPVPNHKKT